MKDLLKAAEKVYGVDPMERTRLRMNVWARRALCAELRQDKYELTLEEIGSVVELDHSSIIHNLKQHSNLTQTDKRYRHYFQRFQKEIGYEIEVESMPILDLKLQRKPDMTKLYERKRKELKDLLDDVDDDSLDGVHIKLEAIVKMSKVKHRIK